MRFLCFCLLASAICFGACSISPAEQPASSMKPPTPNPDKAKRRLFPATDLGLLESADREQWQRVDEILDTLRISDGSVVADIAAGGGWFAARLAKRVGPVGVVYAEEIQPTMIQAISRRMQVENLGNIRPILGTPVDPRLPLGMFDAVLIVNSFHDIETPVPLLENLRNALKSRGLLGVVEFTPGDGGPGPAADERVSPETIAATAAAARLRMIARYPLPPFEFLCVFGK
jgi:SAM-dependent methyltransferase